MRAMVPDKCMQLVGFVNRSVVSLWDACLCGVCCCWLLAAPAGPLPVQPLHAILHCAAHAYVREARPTNSTAINEPQVPRHALMGEAGVVVADVEAGGALAARAVSALVGAMLRDGMVAGAWVCGCRTFRKRGLCCVKLPICSALWLPSPLPPPLPPGSGAGLHRRGTA